MKKVIFPLLIVLIASACSKWKNDEVVYYSEDYKDSDMTILGVHSSNIEALWVELTATDKEYDQYTLIAKSNGELYKETGALQTDWKSSLSFSPEGGDTYNGIWISGKEKYSLTYELDSRSEDLTFIYKKSKCKK